MRSSRSRLVRAGFLALVLVSTGCSDSNDDAAGKTTTTVDDLVVPICASFEGSESLTVGGTNFSEQEIVAELYAQCMEAAGYKIERKFKLGARELVFPALERGDIDMYPEYVGTLLTFLGGTPVAELDATRADLEEALAPKKLMLLEPTEAEDKNGFAVTKATAEKYKPLEKLSDLQPVAAQLVFGAGPECPERPLCLPGLKNTYGLTFKEVKKLDSGGPLTLDALEKGAIDIGLVFTSDGAVFAREFVLLEDDKLLQPAENLAPIVRSDALVGDLKDLLDSVSLQLTTEDLADMNKKVGIDKADPAAVAKTWLQEYGFLAES